MSNPADDPSKMSPPPSYNDAYNTGYSNPAAPQAPGGQGAYPQQGGQGYPQQQFGQAPAYPQAQYPPPPAAAAGAPPPGGVVPPPPPGNGDDVK